MNSTVKLDSTCSNMDQPGCSLYGCSALVADDEPSIRTLNAYILKTMGLSPCTAACGTEAVELFTENQGNFAVAILDIDMPGMDGFELCKQLRKTRPDLPVIFASGSATRDIKEKMNEFQPVTYLPKPYGLKELLLSVRDTTCKTRCESYRERNECVNPALALA